MIEDPEAESDPWVPGIIEHLRRDGHLPSHPLRDVRAWDRARVILHTITAEHVFDAWQAVKKARESDNPNELTAAIIDFRVKLVRWLEA